MLQGTYQSPVHWGEQLGELPPKKKNQAKSKTSKAGLGQGRGEKAWGVLNGTQRVRKTSSGAVGEGRGGFQIRKTKKNVKRPKGDGGDLETLAQ